MTYDKIHFKSESVFLVTGGAGFIGSNLCEVLLDKGYKVRCLDNLSSGKQENVDLFIDNPNYTFIKGDIRNFETCLKASEGVDFILHQAAWGSVPRSIEMPILYEDINIKGTLNMMEAARQNKVKKFVYASSSSVYGDDPKLPKQEGKEGNLLSPYAITKKVNEEYGKIYKTLYNLDTIGLRYFNVFGKRQNPNGPYAAVIPKFIELIKNNKEIIIHGDGSQSRDFTYIDNVILANLLSCKSDFIKDLFFMNIACEAQTSVNELVDLLFNIMNKKTSIKHNEPRLGDVKHSNASILVARTKINYKPIVNIEEGLRKTVDWYTESK
ncbi:MAG: SDR family oxidoreductase [Bacilli bacterium]